MNVRSIWTLKSSRADRFFVCCTICKPKFMGSKPAQACKLALRQSSTSHCIDSGDVDFLPWPSWNFSMFSQHMSQVWKQLLHSHCASREGQAPSQGLVLLALTT